MINAGILDGDLAIIDPQQALKNGEIAAILIDNEATLKRIYMQKDQVKLCPENPDYPIQYIHLKSYDIHLIGKYIGLVREV